MNSQERIEKARDAIAAIQNLEHCLEDGPDREGLLMTRLKLESMVEEFWQELEASA